MSAGRLFQANRHPEQFLKRAILTSQNPLNTSRTNEERREAAPSVSRSWRREKRRLSPAGPLAWPCSPGAAHQPSWREAGLAHKRWALRFPPPPPAQPHTTIYAFSRQNACPAGALPILTASGGDGIDHGLPQNTCQQRTTPHGVTHSGSQGPHGLPHGAPRLSRTPVFLRLCWAPVSTGLAHGGT